MVNTDACILILGDNANDTEVVFSVLRMAYSNLKVCSDPAVFCPMFDKLKPQVLVLAFKSLDTCESVYLNLHRKSAALHVGQHRSIVLCSKEQVQHAYRLCYEGVFDDYVLFWPLVHDVKRLPMSVHLSLETLAHMRAAQPSQEMDQLAQHAEHLGAQLAAQIGQGRSLSRNARTAGTTADTAMHGALASFTHRFVDSVIGDATLIQNRVRATDEARRIGQAEIAPALEQLLGAQEPVRRWVETITDELQGPLASARELARSAQRVRHRILLVDDDEYVRRIVAHTLRQANLEVHAVSSIESARQMLKVSEPNLVLLDYLLPDGTGVELLREMTHSPALHKVPVVMLTGKSDRQVILDCMSNGASDFLVKPVQKNALLGKVRSMLGEAGQQKSPSVTGA